MTRITPFYVTEKKAAALLHMSTAEFRLHVEARHLPRGYEIVPGVLRTEQLKAALDRTKAALGVVPIAARPILIKRDGNPISYRYMADLMLKERKRLGLEAYDLHALRYRGVKELAWAGCDDDEIAAYSGPPPRPRLSRHPLWRRSWRRCPVGRSGLSRPSHAQRIRA